MKRNPYNETKKQSESPWTKNRKRSMCVMLGALALLMLIAYFITPQSGQAKAVTQVSEPR